MHRGDIRCNKYYVNLNPGQRSQALAKTARYNCRASLVSVDAAAEEIGPEDLAVGSQAAVNDLRAVLTQGR